MISDDDEESSEGVVHIIMILYDNDCNKIPGGFALLLAEKTEQKRILGRFVGGFARGASHYSDNKNKVLLAYHTLLYRVLLN